VIFLSLLDIVFHMPPTIHCSYCVQKTLLLYNIIFQHLCVLGTSNLKGCILV
jgi:hypothetical protein